MLTFKQGNFQDEQGTTTVSGKGQLGGLAFLKEPAKNVTNVTKNRQKRHDKFTRS